MKILKNTFSLILIIILLITCIFALTLGFFSAWLHTYNAFTSKVLIATVKISEIKSDANGEFVTVNYTPYNQTSALEQLINPQQGSTATTAQEYKIYGDSVYVAAPVVLFKDELTLLNFKTIYRVGKIYGRYELDNNKEVNRKVQSSFDLNGGIDPAWRTLKDNQTVFPYNALIRSVQLSAAGEFTSKTALQYNLFMNVNGLEWQLVK